jgi:AbrB family looped-hinge helix DNA binding protein
LIKVARVLEGKVSPEGRVSIPAAVRHALGLEAGDRVQFLLEGDTVRLVTARSLAESVWAHNTGGDAVDAGELVRAVREREDRSNDWDEHPLDAGSASRDQGEDDVLALLFPAA